MNLRTPFLIAGLSIALFGSDGWAAKDKGPETMNLKERYAIEGNMPPVIFTHRKHQQKLKCKECHEDPEGGGKLRFEIKRKISVSNDFHTKACWPCHRQMNIPNGTSCSYCHSSMK